jgi:DNA-binding transcriptional regulator YiaG
MPNLASALNDQIRRLSRREITAQTKSTRRLTAQHRRDIAALKREVGALRTTVAFLAAQEKRRVAERPALPAAEGIRFRADGLKSHRAKLGVSAKDYGRLVGVAGLTVYHWEGGKSRPRQQQLAKLAAVRGIGKREALKRLELLGNSNGRTGRRRGT